MALKIRWLAATCFEIRLPSGRTVLTDPYIDLAPACPLKTKDLGGVDYILVTHEALPCIADTGRVVSRFDSTVLCGSHLVEPFHKLFNIDHQRCNFIGVLPGEVMEFEDLRVEVKKAKHPALSREWGNVYKLWTGKEADPKWTYKELGQALPPNLLRSPEQEAEVAEFDRKLLALGLASPRTDQLIFVFQSSDNIRVCLFESGPYGWLRQDIARASCNVFIAKLGGNDPAKMADIAALSGAEVVIPCYHDHRGAQFQLKLEDAMAESLARQSTAAFLHMEHGRWYDIDVSIK